MGATLPEPAPLSEADFARRVRLGPLLAIDLIVRDRAGRVLLGLRNDEPARGFWFVPGGCVLKNEPIEAALPRIALREIHRHVEFSSARFRGVFEHFYRSSRLPSDGLGTHYVVLAHDIAIDDEAAMRPDASHSDYRWFTEADIRDGADVHEYVKDYFRPRRRTVHAPM